MPADVVFALGPHGKPELPGAPVRFNLAHSGDRALIALVDDVEVGVDVERTARSSRAVERTLTDGERAALGPDRHVELLRVWCRKEALAKAIGGGLGWAPEKFDTSRPDGFALIDLELDEGYVGALAVAGERVSRSRVTGSDARRRSGGSCSADVGVEPRDDRLRRVPDRRARARARARPRSPSRRAAASPAISCLRRSRSICGWSRG